MGVLKKFYIRKRTTGTTTQTTSWVDIYDTYGIVCQEFPFKYKPETKEPAMREWPDENGEDIFIPSDGLKFKAYDTEATFLYCGVGESRDEDMLTKIRGFIDYITSSVSSTDGGVLDIYDEYTQLAIAGVYVKEISNEMYDYKDEQINALAKFKVKFRIANPTASFNDLPGAESSSSE